MKRGFARTALLSAADGPSEIEAALKALGTAFVVTNPIQGQAQIEFTKDLGGQSQELLEVIVADAPEGDLTFSIALDRAELAALLRGVPAATLPLEVRLVIDEDGVSREIVAFTQPVTIRRPLLFPELEEVPQIDWLRPLSPKRYIPFYPSQVITGQQFYSQTVGDAEAVEFALGHGLDTEIVWVWGRENGSGGRQLVDGADFSVTIGSANEVTVSALGDAPAAGAWLLTVVSAQTVGAFANELTIAIAQVTGLQPLLDAYGTAISAIIALLPTAPPAIAASSGDVVKIEIRDRSELYPGRRFIGLTDPLATLPRPSALLPALHVATTTSLAVEPLPAPEDNAGEVWINNTGAALLVPGAYGQRTASVADGAAVGSDGRLWYPVRQRAGTTSYFPEALERRLFDELFISAEMLSPGATFSLEFTIRLQMLQATTRAQYLVQVEFGAAPSQATPATTGLNLQDIAWNAVPLEQRVIVGDVAVEHRFGVAVSRAAAGTLTAQRALYGLWTGGAAAPSAADFALRARLLQFDTENSIAGAVGTIHYALRAAKAAVKR